ncbi:hypothetical protein GQ53DRAFT_668001 [Thozetella sp. PMI_491]|nr:hypothetical protein GQ53DRAFT_668001 [Thozetella sp. PMI_491]
MASTGGADPTGNGNSAPGQGSQPRPRGDRGDNQRGRSRGRGGRGRGRGDGARGGAGRGRGRGGSDSTAPAAPTAAPPTAAPATNEAPKAIPAFKRTEPQEEEGDDEDVEVCFICANPIIHHSVAPCNHITCHICALRLRALYKNKDCPHCRTAAPFVIFTDDATKRFEEYASTEITSTDDNIGIKYTSEEIVGDTVLLLRYNCPDPTCDFAGLGWPDLHRHVRSAHHKKMCDLCTRNKKVFTHEHEMFSDKALSEHMKHGDDKPGAVDQTGFKGHPLCGFCGERFYDGDKLYEHCRNKHERCFICDRRDSRSPHYYQDYNALENHFKKDHFLCLDKECLEKKFVVFESEMDLKAHQLSEHGNSLSKDVRRDARVVDMSSFDFRPSYQQERRGGGGQRGREQRGRGRDPNSEPLPPSSAQPLRRDELAFQRTMAIHSAQSVSSRTFGGQLTNPATQSTAPSRPGGGSASQPAGSSAQPAQSMVDAMETLSITDLSSLTPEQRASLTRHGAVVERATNLLGNDANKVATFRSHISLFNRNSMTAEQLIEAFFALFTETSSNALGTLVREVADLFEDKKKGEAVRKAWQNWRAVNEDYPLLPGLGGMHGATTASTGWATAVTASPTTPQGSAAAQKHSTRVLKLKNSTRRGSTSSNGSTVISVGGSSSRTAPAPAASAFPALPGAAPAPQAPRPMWIGGTTPVSRPAAPSRGSGPGPGPAPGPRRAGGNNEEAFPALPAAPKPQTTIFGYGRGAVRRDFGVGRDTGFSWGGASSDAGGSSAPAEPAEQETGGKGKKKNKKQVLVQWG